MTTGSAAGPSYRRDIDGLRAIAVLAVIGYHGRLPGFAGGYVGVDIFFVISGFLITQLILRELQAGRFSLRHFYERRFRRLLPALSLVLLACLIPAWLWMLPEQLTGFAVSAVAVVLMLPNVHFWRSIDYFNPGSEDFPLLHTWSLGIEEQFYIGFSLLMLLLWKVARQRISLTLLLGAIASLLVCEVFRRSSSVGAFYLLPFRAWELLLGGLAAQWHAASLARQSGFSGAGWNRLRSALPWLAIFAIAATFAGFDADTPFPGLWTLLPVSATILLLIWPDADHPVGRLLTCKPLVAIGLISYSAYLWHYPVLVYAELARLQPPGALLTIALMVLVLGLAALSWRFVEQPARRQQLPFSRVATMVALALSVVLVFAWWVWSGAGLPQRLPERAVELLATAQTRNPRQAECLSSTEQRRMPSQACLLGDGKSAPTIVLLGDSHADALFDALDRRLQASGRAGRFMAFGGCPPVPGVVRLGTRNSEFCNTWFSAAYDELAAHPEIDTVIVAARWSTYLEGEPFDNGEGGREPGKGMVVNVLADPGSNRTDADRAARLAEAYRAGIRLLLAMGKRVVLIYPVPEVGWNVPNWLALQNMRGRPPKADLSTSAALFERRNQRAVLALAGIKAAPGQLIEIHPSALFCNSAAAGRCLAQIEGVPMYYDDNHLNLAGASRLVAKISATLDWPAASGSPGTDDGR